MSMSPLEVLRSNYSTTSLNPWKRDVLFLVSLCCCLLGIHSGSCVNCHVFPSRWPFPEEPCRWFRIVITLSHWVIDISGRKDAMRSCQKSAASFLNDHFKVRLYLGQIALIGCSCGNPLIRQFHIPQWRSNGHFELQLSRDTRVQAANLSKILWKVVMGLKWLMDTNWSLLSLFGLLLLWANSSWYADFLTSVKLGQWGWCVRTWHISLWLQVYKATTFYYQWWQM